MTRAVAHILAATCLTMLPACHGPSAANVTLRKQNQQLREELETLRTAHNADAATIRALENRSPGATTRLSSEQLDALFTTHGVRIGRLTRGVDVNPSQPGDEMLRVYVVPTDRDGDALKAAGAFVVEVFDLDAKDQVRLGQWEFNLEETRTSWVGAAGLYEYVLQCPWQTPPQRPQLLCKVSFTDALTGRTFDAQRSARIVPPGPSAR